MIEKLAEKFTKDQTSIVEKGELAKRIPEWLFALLIIVSTVVAAYSVVLTSTFGMADDYNFLNIVLNYSKGVLYLLICAGRPLNGILLDFGFRSAGSIEHLAILRAITLVGIGTLGWGIYLFARKHGVGLISSLSMACGIMLLPAFQIYASWAQHFTTPFAGTLALLSAFILTPACAMRERSRSVGILMSTLLLWTSITIYQPMAMFFCTGILISILTKPGNVDGWSTKRVVDAALVFATANALGFLTLKIGLRYWSSPGSSARGGLVDNIPEKLRWFVSEPLSNAASLYLIPADGTIALIVAAVILVGAFIFAKRHVFRKAWLPLIYAILCVLSSYLPNLATSENWASYRTIGALSASILVLFVLMVSEILNFVHGMFSNTRWLTRSSNYSPLVPTVLLLLLIFGTQSNVSNGIVIPNATELNNLASFMHDQIGQKSGKIAVKIKLSSFMDSAARPMAYDEFGIPASAAKDDAAAMVELLLHNTNVTPVEVLTTAETTIADPRPDHIETLTVDFPRLVTSQRYKTTRPYLSESDKNGISPLNLSDDNWTNGIWTNQHNPNTYSFVYRSDIGEPVAKVGDRLKFSKSGTRTVVRVDFAGDYINILVNPPALSAEDGYPNRALLSPNPK